MEMKKNIIFKIKKINMKNTVAIIGSTIRTFFPLMFEGILL